MSRSVLGFGTYASTEKAHKTPSRSCFFKERELEEDGGKRLSSMLELTWPFGGLYGEIKVEDGPPIAFL